MKNKCFADNGEYCTALIKKKCENCRFYRTDLEISKIEWDIHEYGGKDNGIQRKNERTNKRNK